jgi:hypothetical protein
MNDYDDIDRALFALPLEAPPADLRERILAATVRAPRPAPALEPRDFVLIALLLGALVASGVATFTIPGLAAGITESLGRSNGAIADPMVWLWLAVGGSVVTWFSLVDFAPARVRVRVRS